MFKKLELFNIKLLIIQSDKIFEFIKLGYVEMFLFIVKELVLIFFEVLGVIIVILIIGNIRFISFDEDDFIDY